MRAILAFAVLAVASSCIAANTPQQPSHITLNEQTGLGGELGRLRAWDAGYPRLLFFRNCEGWARAGMPPETFDSYVSKAVGMIGKTFNEEVLNTAPGNARYFSAYKQRHPEQMVLIHFNGLSHDPRFVPETFKAAHWLHHNGCRLTGNLDEHETQLKVEDVSLFKLGSSLSENDNITICGMGSDGRIDWNTYEYVHLVALDEKRNMLTVKRGCLGTESRAWEEGKSYVAAVMARPLDQETGQRRWNYNYSMHAPRDAHGRHLSDVFSDYLAAHLTAKGDCAALDGIGFDMFPAGAPLALEKQVNRAGRGVDCNGDGQWDFGILDGVNQFRLGAREFLVKLREKLGPEKLITVDMGRRGYAGLLNGIESEGWPNPFDPEIDRWSQGMNEHRWWTTRAAQPHASYIHMKYALRRAGKNERVKIADNAARLVMGSAMMLHGVLTVNHRPQADAIVRDELCRGEDLVVNWLGRPLEPPRRLVFDTPSLYADRKTKVFEAKARDADSFGFALKNLPCGGKACTVRFEVRCEPLQGFPTDTARRLVVGLDLPDNPHVNSRPYDWTWMDGEWFEASFFLRNMDAKAFDLLLNAEGRGAVQIRNLAVYTGADVMTRRFENGLVLVNPSNAPFAFDLKTLYSDFRGHRLKSRQQKAPVIAGQFVSGTVTVPPRDSLFLVESD